MCFRPVTHVIFDLDGLLLDTEFIYENIFREICNSFGKDYPWDVRMKVMGTTEKQSAETLVNEVGLPISINKVLEILDEKSQKCFKQLNLLKGSEKLVRHLYEAKVPFCLATSSGKGMAELKMSSHQELFALFYPKVYGNTDPEVKNGKPAPDIFLIAAQRFDDQPNPDKCLVFEDSPNGVKAAIAAGMQCVMVPDKAVEPDRCEEATIVLDSLEDFRPEMFGLPSYTN